LAWNFSSQGNETERYAHAKAEYGDHHFRKSADAFQALITDFPDSEKLDEYQFLTELSQLRDYVDSPQTASEQALDRVLQFLRAHERSPFLQTYGSGIGETLQKLGVDLAQNGLELLRRRSNLERAKQTLAMAEQARTATLRFIPGSSPDGTLSAILETLRRQLVEAQEIRIAIEKVRLFGPSFDNLRNAEAIFRRLRLNGDGEAQDLLARLRDGIQTRVQYAAGAKKPMVSGVLSEASYPSLLIVSGVRGDSLKKPGGSRVVFALARGVLYALAAANGEVVWATRVGIDTSSLPVRFPATESTPELALVLSSDTNILTARETLTGREIWNHQLTSPCLGRPLVVDQMAYVATYDGSIFEIDVPSGRIVGHFQVGAPLSGHGAYEKATDTLYFPAQAFAVYVISRKDKVCTGILETGHASNSLRGDPIVVDPGKAVPGGLASGHGYLVLAQAEGLGNTLLAAYPLPITGVQTATPVQPEIRLPGWSWFAPFFDGEKIAQVTDVGTLSVIGVNQHNDQDQPLFFFAPSQQGERPAANVDQMERGQVVHADEHDFWVLVHGCLAHYQLGIDRIKGLVLVKDATHTLELGAPLHAGQVNQPSDALFVVTQSLGTNACLATSVDTETSRVLWQRQLGLICDQGPLRMGEYLLVTDEAGGLTWFESKKMTGEPDRGWIRSGASGAEPLANLLGSGVWLRSSDLNTWYQVLCHRKLGTGSERSSIELIVRQVRDNKSILERKVPLRDAISGTPALLGDYLLLPLANGDLFRVKVDGTDARFGVSWRSTEADPEAPGHLVTLSDNEFLTTDGARGLSQWQWPQNDVAILQKTVQLPERLVQKPVLVPLKQGQGVGPLICVADVVGTLRLLTPGDLKTVRTWQIGGRLTAGPFLCAGAIGCVVDRTKLILLRSDGDKPLWEYRSADPIIGEPQPVGPMVVVADMSGAVFGLDVRTGQKSPKALALKGTVVATASPLACGPDRLFVPLSDGTIALPSLDTLR
jgi:hypothetical protein